MSETHPVAIQFGVPRSVPEFGWTGGDGASEHTYKYIPRKGQYCETIRSGKIMKNKKASDNNTKALGKPLA